MDKTRNLVNDVAMENGLYYAFVEFMCKRFPQERDRSYIEEWAKRFKSGNVQIYMDSESLAVYKEVL